MGLFDKIAGQFIDIIEWNEQYSDELVHRFERYEHEIKIGAQLIVRPGQKAVFVNEGQIADVFSSGKYTLETQNIPILSTLKGWKYGFNSPFKAEVYFLNLTEQLDRKWGTATPVILRDADLGMVRVRAHGNFSYKVSSDSEMLSRLVGARHSFGPEDIEGQLKSKLVSSFSDSIAELNIAVLDLQAQYDEISEFMAQKLSTVFSDFGLTLLGFVLENVTVPEDVEKAMDQRASMGAVGDLNKFSQFQAAQALEDAANNPGMAGNMMGMMVGGGLAGNMGNVLHHEEPSVQVPIMICPKCSAENAGSAKFCGECGHSMSPENEFCIKCNAEIAPKSKFCSACGAPQQAKCSECGADMTPNSKFCGECGKKSN
ncbi:MAG: SPFH domain-containing protein [Kiritimatiellae bacterium]|jgi:membrane protease subunit (stomatin/prohibitin family)|nr:SPFH domain-containing protein [Kiritimatiellia bacterium]